MRKLWKSTLVMIVLGCWASVAVATPVTCLPMNERVATLDSAVECKTGNDENINTPAEVSSLFGGSWVKEGELTGNGTNDLFSVVLTTGSWGQSNVAGTWTLDDSFWTVYGLAVITMHVGHGNGNPDYFAWSLTQGATSGTFEYRDLDGRGGGLSNLFLFGSGTPDPRTVVSESGLNALLVIGLLAMFFVRRRISV